MDAPEEDLDIKLQKISGDLITEFDRSLPLLLRKPDGAGGTVVRSRVRTRETQRLISSLLDPFQELPQLLDPHLPKWLPQLGDAFLDYHVQQQRHLTARRSRAAALSSTHSDLLMPLPTAICRLLYTLCKIRGEKVIVRFLRNDTRYLELLLSAIEEAEQRDTTADGVVAWTWEERYVVLLWLSHLMFAPFDLATISSTHVDDEGDGETSVPFIPGFVWPNGGNLPGIAIRILPLAVKYLASPGKERDAAKALLVRISMRKDMQQLGVLDALVCWALGRLQPGGEEDGPRTPYHYIGVLSFLAGILGSSADTSDMDSYLTMLFRAVHGASSSEDPGGEVPSVMSSAMARRIVIKVMRAIAVLVLRSPQPDEAGTELVETTIGFLLESLADNDTPVRLAASKALSIVTLKLHPEMASQVVEAVLESLNKNVLWSKKDAKNPDAPRTRDLSAVDPFEWHGLMLSLSHLLYRRSPPAGNLADIIQALVMGLSFEQRNPSGGSMGANVRDAACFGIWALARRYTTKELLAVKTPAVLLAKYHSQDASVLQVLASELIVSASLDSAGNIRRGSSAALQELIGRHPDTVVQGIWVVQTVDYHAVALRSRALQEVALGATKLSEQYGEAVLSALLGWRGVGDVDAASRRVAGASYGTITAELASASPDPMGRLIQSTVLVLGRIKGLQARQVEERHGLFLSFGSLLDAMPGIVDSNKAGLDEFIRISLEGLEAIMAECNTNSYRRPELIAEAVSQLVISSFPLLQAATLLANGSLQSSTLLPGRDLLAKSNTDIARLATELNGGCPSLANLTALIKSYLHTCLLRPEEEVIPPASQAGLVLLIFSPTKEREAIIREWAESVRHRPSGRASTAGGFFSALVLSYSVVSTLHLSSEEEGDDGAAFICDAILARWASDKDTDVRVLILRSLTGSELLAKNLRTFIGVVTDGLDDYHTNARGDVGSLVRFRALRATRALWEGLLGGENKREEGGDEDVQLASTLFLRVLRLAAEKLDRVRAEAQAALAAALDSSYATTLRTSTFSSRSYFTFLLSLYETRTERLHPLLGHSISSIPSLQEKWTDELMAGLVSSADTGNEDLVIASRAALCAFCSESCSKKNRDVVCAALVRNLRVYQGDDRVLVPTLEVVAFLFHVGVFSIGGGKEGKRLCLLVQRACFKTGNVRKIEACVRVYGGIASASSSAGRDGGRDEEGRREARKRVRSLVVDELWGLFCIGNEGGEGEEKGGMLLGVDWGAADKGAVRGLVEGLRLG
ncbi:tubulin folding cofactor D C terminal-domain-containing protein [Echria macrotheca]|uniref:Tubulin folding cofactor D C terminal-domain-containing protein n=1 Tax=Echria macrotheca TaxID=438768 RepID=A0AAJ0BH73_9PEZI|nr:tubulin folding cofactor D C terminal-domain-containing protein [Echria macrotheca]